MLYVFLFEIHEWASNLINMLKQYLLLNNAEKFCKIVHQGLPVRLPNHEAFALSMRSVDENLTFVEADFESAYDCVLSNPKPKLLRFIDLIPNIVVSFLNE